MPTPTEIGWAADATRFRLGFEPGRIDPYDAIRRTGAYLLRVPVGSKDESIEGAFTRRRGRNFVLINTGTYSLSRQRFSGAHELGHLVLHGDRDRVIVDVEIGENDDAGGDERDADIFAGAFLMDEMSARAAVIDCQTVEEMVMTLRHTFVVSVPAAAHRLHSLGLATAEDVQAIRRRQKKTLAARSEAAGVASFRDRVAAETDIEPKLVSRLDELRANEIITNADRRKLLSLT